MISASTVSIPSSFSAFHQLFDLPYPLRASHEPKPPAMNAPGINSAAPPTGNRPQRPSLLPVNPSASASSGAASSAGSGSSSALALGSAGAAGQSSGHIPSQSPVQTEAGQAQSQAATSPSSTSAGTYMQRSRRRWTAEEDEKLISAVKAYGSARGPGSAWSLISQGIPGRTNKVSHPTMHATALRVACCQKTEHYIAPRCIDAGPL